MVDRVEITPEAPQQDASHEQAMIDKFDTANAAEAPAEDRPEWLPKKFTSPEDLAKAYAALEAKLGQPKEPEAAPEVKAEEAPQGEAEKALASKGLDFNEFQAEFSEQGALSDESLARLEKAGIPREIVDAYIEGQQLRAASIRDTVFKEIGGEDAFNTTVAWAKDNLSAEEIAAYNKVVDSGDVAATRLAVQGLHARYRASEAFEPVLVRGKSAVGATDAFESWAQVTQAMKSPEYRRDPAFRAKVEAKLSRSKL
jgi:hypothetical protein